jgi:glycosyltransferase involved in cell wall biosynthesis
VFVSLLGRGDMRSASVLQAAASGAAPIIADNPEYREMEKMGFQALFVAPGNVEEVIDALRVYLDDPAKIKSNDDYLARNEDYGTQMTRMLELIECVCERYAGA